MSQEAIRCKKRLDTETAARRAKKYVANVADSHRRSWRREGGGVRQFAKYEMHEIIQVS